MIWARKTSDPFYVVFSGGRFEATGVCKGASTDKGLFAKTDHPEPADLMVWPDRGVDIFF
jgi:hypothetical protein